MFWNPSQAERDWKNSYREIPKFLSNIYSILFAKVTFAYFFLTLSPLFLSIISWGSELRFRSVIHVLVQLFKAWTLKENVDL